MIICYIDQYEIILCFNRLSHVLYWLLKNNALKLKFINIHNHLGSIMNVYHTINMNNKNFGLSNYINKFVSNSTTFNINKVKHE